MTSCIGEPVSYLRLERFALRELPEDEQRSVAEHLAQCQTCRACHERIAADGRASDVAALVAKLRAAPVLPPRAAGRLVRARVWATGAAALSLVGLLAVLATQPNQQPARVAPGATPHTKGDGLALELTRVDESGQQLEPTRFAPSDRFRVALSCPPALAVEVRVLAFQAGETFEPLPAQTLASCGNRRLLAGAFRLDGDEPVDLCVLLGDVDVTAVRSLDGLPEPHVCARIAPLAHIR